MAGLRMKISVSRRRKYLRNRIYDERTRILCRNNMETKAFTRNRKITFSDLLLLTLNKQGRNVSFEIRDYEINKKGEQKVNYTDEAYLKQRRQLNPEVFKELNRGYLKDFYNEKKYVKKYKGYVVWAIDGSKIEITNTKQNREELGSITGGNAKKGRIARALISGAYDVYNKFYGDMQVCHVKTYEGKIAYKNIEECVKINKYGKNLFVLDRNYAALDLFNKIGKKNESKFVIRLTINDYVRERKEMKSDDEIIEIKYDRHRMHHYKKKNPELYEELKETKSVKLRIVNVKLETGEIETLITNIFTKKFTIEDFKEIYKARWKIEESYNSIKNKLKIEKFTGNLPIYVYQDIYAQVLVYNQVQDILNSKNEELRKRNKKKNLKYEYQINENKAIGLFKEQFIKIMLIEDKNEAVKAYDKLSKEMVKYVSAIRKERKTEKRVWNPNNKFHSNRGATF